MSRPLLWMLLSLAPVALAQESADAVEAGDADGASRTDRFGDEYEVGAGDTLHVQVYTEPSLTVDVAVNDACAISLGLIGRVSVCGQTPGEIEEEITRRYADGYLVDPTVSVQVTSYRSQRVDVLGEVAKPGPQYLEGPTSLVEVISLAGGPAADNVVSVQVAHADGSSDTYDLLALRKADPVRVKAGDKVYLKPGQVVYVEGQISRPGAVTLQEGLTVTQAVALAGGPAEFANTRRVLVRRADGEKIRINLQRVHKGLDDDVVLEPDDHLLVPRGGF